MTHRYTREEIEHYSVHPAEFHSDTPDARKAIIRQLLADRDAMYKTLLRIRLLLREGTLQGLINKTLEEVGE